MRWRFVLQSVSAMRLLNDLSRADVKLDRVKREGRRLSFVVTGLDKGKVIAYLDEHGLAYRIRRASPMGLAYVGLKRPVLPLCALCLAVLLFLSFRLVWQIDVAGASSEINAQAQAIVAPYLGKWQHSIDTDSLCRQLVALDGVAQASVTTNGVKLKVELLTSLPKGELIEEQNAPIVASCDCVIRSIVVERGRALVKVGDTVKAGDVLIAPEYLVDKNADVTVPCPAIGTVTGLVYYEREEEWYRFETLRQFTGKETRSAVIKVGDKTLGALAPNPYALGEETVESIATDWLLPLVVERHTYREVVQTTVERDWNAQKEGFEAAVLARLEENIKKGVHLERKWCIIKETGFGYKIYAYAQAVTEVSTRPS